MNFPACVFLTSTKAFVNAPRLTSKLNRHCCTVDGPRRGNREQSSYSINKISFIRLIKFWHRLTQMDEECLANKALRTTENSLGELTCWYATVKTLLKLIGFTDLWKHPSRYCTNRVHALFKEKLNLFFQQFWKHELCNADRTVSEIKNCDHMQQVE